MEWDMKASSSQWDWENLMLFPNKGNDKNETCGHDGRSSFGYASSLKSEAEEKREVGLEELRKAEENRRVQVQPDEPSKVSKEYDETEQGSGGGRRTDFEDASAIKSVKKRGVCESVQPPRCQVEGCNTDLSSCKDYHRRHKVCETHSKTAMVVVDGQDQRFCQQCSRFHVLSEFDDGKRSCRRRLADHNERRRKSQPNVRAMNSTRLESSFYDGSRTGFLMDRSSFMQPRSLSSSVLDGHNEFKLGHSRVTWPTIVKMENHLSFDGHIHMPAVNWQSYANALSRQQADKQLISLQSNKAAAGNLLSQGNSDYVQIPVNAIGKALTLASSAPTGVLGGLEMGSATENLRGVSDSGRALSLLSSHLSGSRAPGSAALDLFTRPGFTLEHFIHGNHSSVNHIPVQGMQHNLGLVSDKFLNNISSQSPTGLVSNGYTASAMSTMEKAHQGGPLVDTLGVIGNFETPMHCFLQTQEWRSSHDSRSKDVRCTIDLMQRSSQELSNESQKQSSLEQNGNGQYMEFQLMRSYEQPVFDSQHM